MIICKKDKLHNRQLSKFYLVILYNNIIKIKMYKLAMQAITLLLKIIFKKIKII